LDIWRQKEAYRFDHLVTAFGNHKANAITPVMVEAYRKREMGNGRTFDTVAREIKLLKVILNYGVKLGFLSQNPIVTIKYSHPLEERRPEILTPEDEQRLFAYLTGDRAKYRPLVTLALATGLRRNELLTLEWRDIDFRSRLLTVRPECAKSRKARTLPLNQAALEALFSIRNNGSGRVFGHLPAIEGIQSAMRRVFKEAGIEKQGGGKFHLFRHAHATRLLMNGADIRTVQSLLGHSDVKLTMVYLHTTEELKRDAVERLTMAATR
jgi:integrase